MTGDRWEPRVRPEPTSTVHAQRGKIRPEGLGELRKEIRPVGLAGMINIVMLLGTKWYTRLLVTGKPFV